MNEGMRSWLKASALFALAFTVACAAVVGGLATVLTPGQCNPNNALTLVAIWFVGSFMLYFLGCALDGSPRR